MSMLVEVSNDKIDWRPYERTKTKIEDYQWIRATEYVEKSWSRSQIDGWLNTQSRNKEVRIEYSMDGGFSFTPFRLGQVDDGARIFSVMQNTKYSVRAMALTENNNYVPPADTRAAAFINAGYNPTGEKKIRTQLIKRWVVAENGGLWIKKSVPFDPASIVCLVEQRIPMTLKEPNVNIVTLGPQTHNRSGSLADYGHVYELSPCTNLTFNWRTVMSAHRRETINPAHWAWVESARSYDSEIYQMTRPIKALAVLSDKFYVDNSGQQADKIGCRFLIPRAHVSTFIQDVVGNGGYATWMENKVEEQTQTAGVLETIMAAKEELKEAIASRNADILAKKLFETVEFRDKAIDELKELNVLLAEARKTAIELIAEEQDGSSTRSH